MNLFNKNYILIKCVSTKIEIKLQNYNDKCVKLIIKERQITFFVHHRCVNQAFFVNFWFGQIVQFLVKIFNSIIKNLYLWISVNITATFVICLRRILQWNKKREINLIQNNMINDLLFKTWLFLNIYCSMFLSFALKQTNKIKYLEN